MLVCRTGEGPRKWIWQSIYYNGEVTVTVLRGEVVGVEGEGDGDGDDGQGGGSRSPLDY